MLHQKELENLQRHESLQTTPGVLYNKELFLRILNYFYLRFANTTLHHHLKPLKHLVYYEREKWKKTFIDTDDIG